MHYLVILAAFAFAALSPYLGALPRDDAGYMDVFDRDGAAAPEAESSEDEAPD